jgi:hypothetical protein
MQHSRHLSQWGMWTLHHCSMAEPGADVSCRKQERLRFQQAGSGRVLSTRPAVSSTGLRKPDVLALFKLCSMTLIPHMFWGALPGRTYSAVLFVRLVVLR